MEGGAARKRELVLVGGGHAHVQVLARLAMSPPAATAVTLVADTPIAVYSGMVPGLVAGQYRRDELEIDLLPLARRAGARLIVAPMLAIDPGGRRIVLAGRPPIRYDLAAFNIGSTVAGLDLPGVRQHALPTRPIGELPERIDALLDRACNRPRRRPFRVVVVGGGAGGVEIGFTLQHRLTAGSPGDRGPIEVTLLDGGSRLLQGYSRRLAGRAAALARARGIAIRLAARVVAAEPDAVRLDSGEVLPCDALLWVTGAAALPVFRDSGLPTDARGFVRVDASLRVEGHDDLFAAGDCAALVDHPDTPKAGVYAVRQGPVLADNLAAALAGRPLGRYRPQRDFLTLLNLGDGTALGGKWGQAFEGAWVMRLKDRIDRRFLGRFQVLDREGAPIAAAPPSGPAMAGGEAPAAAMLCGGCAAKVGEEVLDRALARIGPGAVTEGVVLGLAARDDAAAVLSPSGDLVVSTVDAFRGFTDDPWLVGRVAAVSAVSDLLAKGVRPRHALALVAIPEGEDAARAEETLFQVVAGARAGLDPLGVALLGGHTTIARDLLVGFAVHGFASREEALLGIDRLEPGQVLVLTKPLGTGVVFRAEMLGLCPGRDRETAIVSMLRPNHEAMAAARAAGATAATDVTGFGLARHLLQMLRASRLGAVVDVAALPALPGSVALLGQGLRSTAHAQNQRRLRGLEVSAAAAVHPHLPLVFDPQTSGGLLFGVPVDRAAEAIARLRQGGDAGATAIGRVVAEAGGGEDARLRLVVGNEPC